MAELVGILNMTPDSFSDGGKHDSGEAALRHAGELFGEGASIVDVGAESTRPGAEAIGWREEVARLSGFIEKAGELGWSVSLDTYHPETVAWAGRYLASFIINDVSGFRDPAMREIAAGSGNRVIAGHLPEACRNVQEAHRGGPVDSLNEVVEELHASVEELVRAGVKRDDIIVDPGIGFGKTKKLNWELLRLGLYVPGQEVMVGYSRKRFLGGKRLAIESNLSAGRIAVAAGAKYLRVHDVRGHASLI